MSKFLNDIFVGLWKVWHQGNMGSNSGMDSDLLDGKHGSEYSLVGHTHTLGELTGGVAFKAVLSTTQAISSNVNTKLLFRTEHYDYTNNYDTTNSRFIAPANGVYRFNASLNIGSGVDIILKVYKNGVFLETIYDVHGVESANATSDYLLSTNDYIEIWVLLSSNKTAIVNGTFFSGNRIY
jgi:hypothetical protein